MRNRCLIVAWMLVFLALGIARSVPAQTGAAGGEVFTDEWLIMRMAGVEVGHAHILMEWVDKDGERLMRSTSEGVFEIKRLGQEIKLSMSSQTLEDAQGKLRWVRSVQDLSSQKTIVEGEVREGKMIVRTTVYGNTTEKTLDWDGSVLGSYGAYLLRARHMNQPGATFEYKVFSAEMVAQIVTMKGKVAGPVKKQVLGDTRNLVEIHEESSLMPGIVSRIWVDAKATSVVQYTEFMGGIEMILVSRERALNKEEAPGGGGEDILLKLSIQSNVILPYPYRVESALYRVEVKTGDPEEFTRKVTSERQVVLKRDGNRIWLRIAKTVPGPGESSRIPYSGSADMAEYLEPNDWLQSEDPVVRAAALEAIGGEADAWKASKKLERWVYEHIGNKNMTVGFASAREVCEKGEGDCSEHAVLLAAVLRSVGIPSRVCMGVVYFNKVFAGHAWTEAFIGKWVPLDATMARPFVSAMHFGFGRSSLAEEGMEMLMGIGAALGNIDFDILEYTLDGKIVREEEFNRYAVNGDVYRNELFGIELSKPVGWEFDDLDKASFGSELLEMKGKDEKGSRRIRVSTQALPYNMDFFSLVDLLASRGNTVERKTISVGARQGVSLVIADPDDEQDKQSIVAVTVDELLFLFRTDWKDDLDAKYFQEVLSSVKWIGR